MKHAAILLGLIAVLGFDGAACARIAYAEAKELCGSLGVMNTTSLPEGVDPDKVRVCAEHPLSSAVKESVHDEHKRWCWEGRPVGCSGGYCFKSCAQPGSGEWCWTAKEQGFGDWATCGEDEHCSVGFACGAGGCASCGCSC
ncbi:hypothetical protein AAL_02285 [Moelleriella libera RCEF 2490]|uniref:IDI-2 n=1 Tax=Moelleriella libera RCEF 2490 TaxID=1081109 RepID=A0A168FC70_9HYPO|nr:hypothetical protein AAL_02285 [Moelleriella libera RCEF 2490]